MNINVKIIRWSLLTQDIERTEENHLCSNYQEYQELYYRIFGSKAILDSVCYNQGYFVTKVTKSEVLNFIVNFF